MHSYVSATCNTGTGSSVRGTAVLSTPPNSAQMTTPRNLETRQTDVIEGRLGNHIEQPGITPATDLSTNTAQ